MNWEVTARSLGIETEDTSLPEETNLSGKTST